MPDEPQNDSQQGFIPEKQKAIREHLRKLRQFQRMNINAEMAQKAQGAFDVSTETDTVFGTAQALNSPVSLMVYPQDPFVSEPEVRELQPYEVKPNLRNSRLRTRDSRYPPAKPDNENNYMFWIDQPEFDQVNSFYYAHLTLRMFEKYADRQIAWAFGSPLLYIDAHFDEGFSAFYDEHNKMIGFSWMDSEDGVVSTAQSADVVSHETAHAVLDGLRDLYNQSISMGPLAFHESFGDLAAVLVALHDDSLVKRLLDWTEGDLRIGTFVTEVAEHLFEVLKNREDIQELNERTVYLRNALNKFKRIPFDDLEYFPSNPTHQLGRESHNYSRLFTGACYDLMVAIYEHIRDDEGVKPRIAVHRARDVMGHLLIYAVEVGPVGELNFADMARALLTADRLLNDGEHLSLIREAFAYRLILSQDEAQAHLDSLDNLPKLRLPQNVDSQLQASLFLMDEVLPALGLPEEDYQPLSAHRNHRGFAFFTYFTRKRVRLDGPQYREFQNVAVDMFGGITLAFSPDGELCSALYRPVTEEDIRQAQVITIELINHGLVTIQGFARDGEVMSYEEDTSNTDLPTVMPRFLYLDDSPLEAGERSEESEAQLVRVPVIMDVVPPQRLDFPTYLKAWKNREY